MDTLTRTLGQRAAQALEDYRAEADADWAKQAAATAEQHQTAAHRELVKITGSPVGLDAVTVDPDTFTARATLDGIAFVSPHVPHADGIVRWHLALACPDCAAGTWTETFVVDLRSLGSMLDEPRHRLATHNRTDGQRCDPTDQPRPGDPEPRHVFAFAAGTRQLREHYDRIAPRCRVLEFKQMGTGVVLIGELWPIATADSEGF